MPRRSSNFANGLRRPPNPALERLAQGSVRMVDEYVPPGEVDIIVRQRRLQSLEFARLCDTTIILRLQASAEVIVIEGFWSGWGDGLYRWRWRGRFRRASSAAR